MHETILETIAQVPREFEDFRKNKEQRLLEFSAQISELITNSQEHLRNLSEKQGNAVPVIGIPAFSSVVADLKGTVAGSYLMLALSQLHTFGVDSFQVTEMVAPESEESHCYSNIILTAHNPEKQHISIFTYIGIGVRNNEALHILGFGTGHMSILNRQFEDFPEEVQVGIAGGLALFTSRAIAIELDS